MMLSPLKSLLPDRPLPLPILSEPFRGATIRLNPCCSLEWLDPTNFFLIEVYQEEFLPQLQQQFSNRGIALKHVNQHSLPIVGRETRSPLNWWLVSELPSGQL